MKDWRLNCISHRSQRAEKGVLAGGNHASEAQKCAAAWWLAADFKQFDASVVRQGDLKGAGH